MTRGVGVFPFFVFIFASAGTKKNSPNYRGEVNTTNLTSASYNSDTGQFVFETTVDPDQLGAVGWAYGLINLLVAYRQMLDDDEMFEDLLEQILKGIESYEAIECAQS
jgi:hypothetical protein